MCCAENKSFFSFFLLKPDMSEEKSQGHEEFGSHVWLPASPCVHKKYCKNLIFKVSSFFPPFTGSFQNYIIFRNKLKLFFTSLTVKLVLDF